MFDRIFLFLGAMTSAAGVAFQGMAMGAPTAHTFTLQIIAIVSSSIGAGCLAVSPSVRNGLTKDASAK
jgi:Na+/citrate or Na+/malate symporter